MTSGQGVGVGGWHPHPLFDDQERLAFYDSGFPTEAGVTQMTENCSYSSKNTKSKKIKQQQKEMPESNSTILKVKYIYVAA